MSDKTRQAIADRLAANRKATGVAIREPKPAPKKATPKPKPVETAPEPVEVTETPETPEEAPDGAEG
jgi:hypothetical protein